MSLISKAFAPDSIFGMDKWLKREHKIIVNPKRIRRLLRKMGLMAVYPKRNLSKPYPHYTEDSRIGPSLGEWSATRKSSRNGDLGSLGRIASHSHVHCVIAKINWILTR
jgi:hypothetical protein